MDTLITRRALLTGTGAVAGLALFALSELAAHSLLIGLPLLAVATLIAAFFAALLAMAGPLTLGRAAVGAALVAVTVTLLLTVAALGFAPAQQVLDSAHAVLGAVILTLVPLPFWIARHGAGWRDYATLFRETWAMVVRAVAAWAFVGLVWAMILLSDALLKAVGIDLIDRMMDTGPFNWLVTGAALGLALAVVQELSEYVSPYLILRLLRLLLPVVFVVSAVFLLALPFRGVTGLFGSWSFAVTLLTMAGAVAALVSVVIDQSDTEATASPVLARIAQAMALMLPVLAGLGAWAVWLRVAQYGWTPDRLFASQVAALGLGYGVLYARAVVSGPAWMAKVRQANVMMALVLMAMAAASMTPILSPERLSANSLMARLEDGRLPLAELDLSLLDRWGKPGAEALARLEQRSAEPGQEALAEWMAQTRSPSKAADRESVLAEVATLMPLQPESASATRDIYLTALDTYRLGALRESCVRQMPGGGPGCVMVVADLQPGLPGEEALLLEYSAGGYVQFTGFHNDALHGPSLREVLPANGALPQYEAGEALIRAWQASPPAAMPLSVNQLNLPGGGGLILAP
ncbi:DUF4153 domain-containing protein [Pseudorhodobacter sp. MZDSW-24AT]|uniref:DUF4153 domain-containing protein n=1 Tax=Pseudorhodobacter sp. MZDSW-24AT TaxID=2052957 RepID=UPI000C1E15DC|nr:DUF4153 domain-containing protein [Pseudorhodobacter sp. MZDSW-24AT]PJF11079.1 DUF4153 domain-containing protein [Pseudorhodobacter sp. MZDSW-24AT]